MAFRHSGCTLVLAISLLLSVCPAHARAEEAAPQNARVEAGTISIPALLRRAARGDAVAQFELGCYYGSLDETHWAEAAAWYRRAAGQRNSQAEYALGVLYSFGSGVKKNMTEGRKWYQAAAEHGHVRAQAALGAWYFASKRYKDAATWYRAAAEQGDCHAQSLLAEMYARGEGVKRSAAESYFWSGLACSPGVTPRDFYAGTRDQVTAELTPQEIAALQERIRNWKPKPTRATDLAQEAESFLLMDFK